MKCCLIVYTFIQEHIKGLQCDEVASVYRDSVLLVCPRKLSKIQTYPVLLNSLDPIIV